MSSRCDLPLLGVFAFGGSAQARLPTQPMALLRAAGLADRGPQALSQACLYRTNADNT